MSGNEQWNVNGVTIKANGEVAGQASASETLSAVVTRFATSRGIRQFTVFKNGTEQKLYTTDGSKTLTDLGATELNIVTKDQRAIWFV